MQTKLAHDIGAQANIKLASILDYIKPALVGGGLLTGAAAIPALLNSYVHDEDPLKSLANVSQYTLPIGMALGAGTVPLSKIENLILGAINRIPTKADIIKGSEELIQSLAKNSSNGEASVLSSLGKLGGGIGDALSAITREVAQTGSDIAGLLG